MVGLFVWIALSSLNGYAKGVFYPCYRVATPPGIDGVLDEREWQLAERIDFADLVTGARADLASSVKLLWDNERLYLAFTFADTNIWARITKRDTPSRPDFKAYTENFAKVYLDPDGDSRNYTEMHFSPSGAINDKWQNMPWRSEARKNCGLPESETTQNHWEWNCEGIQVAVAVQGTLNNPGDLDQGWVLEIAIPFAAMKRFAGSGSCPPKPDDTWRIHLGRRYQLEGADPSKASYWTWPTLGVKDCHNPDKWGYLVFVNATHPVTADTFSNLPKGKFKWKMLCVHKEQTTTKEAIDKMLADAQRMGFDSIYAELSGDLVAAVHRKGMKIYAWMINLRGHETVKEFFKSHPDYAQQVRPVEAALIGKPRLDPDRENIHSGEWLCPDRGLLDVELSEIKGLLKEGKADGIGLDYVGYRNYHACYCAYSVDARRQYAKSHPDLSAAQVLWKFSEESLARYVQQVRAVALAVNPDARLVIHIYPDFDPNPLYGNRLAVDYCGQTVAWFFHPFWPYSRVADLTLQYKTAQGRYHKFNQFVPFIGAYSKYPKTPEQLKTEIRIAGMAGTGAIMIAFYETFMNDPVLAAVLAEELK